MKSNESPVNARLLEIVAAILDNPSFDETRLAEWRADVHTRKSCRQHALAIIEILQESGVVISLGTTRKATAAADALLQTLRTVPASTAYVLDEEIEIPQAADDAPQFADGPVEITPSTAQP